MDATSAANQYLNAGRYDDLSTLGGKYIRLLGIDTASSHMKCTLRTVNLDERPQYTALSYVWGDLSDIRFIECNGSPLCNIPGRGPAVFGSMPPHLCLSTPKETLQKLEVWASVF
ncbi:uncharacterized protein K444DRAFT_612868 [Hyaloscypha bicolor E]|uniref:Heterokaryon incompatibility domain-containing protein n=1 Tax=Hyaloscypha bicolor E TaxID=1095630 RepID=A0A2J6T9V7_9HELO|nr:uncharacterized protein K444DRAFT_612868 [Hyaloscypha bicolor E]PMD59795.1 hypothetical protein K444DRAFT_612868 [Hyaloscypha bicolor E]